MASSSNLTLTQVAVIARKAIYLLAAGFFLLAVVTYFMRQFQEYQRLHPPQVREYPNYLFGKLPDIQFPEEKTPRKKISLEFSTGAYPVFPTLVAVFKIQESKTPGFDPVSTARTFAKKMDSLQEKLKYLRKNMLF